MAVPTDTFYGLLADPFSKAAMATLRGLKQVASSRPWPILIPRDFDLKTLGCELSESGSRLAARFWPGKVTLIVACQGPLAQVVGRSSDGAVGLRMPGGPAELLHVLRLWNGPLTGTSANPGGAPPAETLEQLNKYFPSQLACSVPGQAPGGAPSTVVDTVDNVVRIVRPGAVSAEQIAGGLAS